MHHVMKILATTGLLTNDLDYHLVRASMVIIFLAIDFQRQPAAR
jgi:hypothetical protein